MQMEVVRLRADDPYSVSKLTMEEIANQPPPLNILARGWRFMKLMLMAWGAISLGAAIGVGAYFWSGVDEPLIVGEERPAPTLAVAREAPAPPVAETATILATSSAEDDSSAAPEWESDATASISERMDPAPLPVDVAAVESAPTADVLFAPAAMPLPLGATATLAETRVPRPRPNEPVITGSIRPPPYDPGYRPAHRRIFAGPCNALKRIGVPVRCATRVRQSAPPPPRQAPIVVPASQAYYPAPYQPPATARP